MGQAKEIDFKPTACMLCSIGCAIEIQVEGRHFKKIRGDKLAPSSQGYLCQKAARLDHYQNHSERLKQPLKRQPDGSFAPVSWEQAIQEIAEKMKAIKAGHGGHAFAYYGGGGQGNHLGGTYSGALRAALGTPYLYTALAQEKTGDFWVNGELFGRQSVLPLEGMEHADYAIVLGANPFTAHGLPRTRDVLKAFKSDPARTLVVIDPRVSETARMADIHLQVKPGHDAYLLAAMIAILFRENRVDEAFLRERTTGHEAIRKLFETLPVEDFIEASGVPAEKVYEVARGFASAHRATVRADLGIQQSLHSTLNSWLEKLLYLVTGNFNRKGGNHLGAQFAPFIGHSKKPGEGAVTTRVTGMHEICKLFPPNILPLEIDTDHPERVRALIVDSGNIARSGADTRALEKALRKLELLVVIDVAMTETARHAHYVLPAPTQFEKAEATFFTYGFPVPYFHLRKPVLEKEGDTLPEPEIYRRLLVALGAIPERFPVLERAAKLHRRYPGLNVYPAALAATLKLKPHWQAYVPVILYATLGRALQEDKASAASLWGVSQFWARRFSRQVARAGYTGKPAQQAEKLFQRMLDDPRPIPLGEFEYEDLWKLIRHPDGKIHLYIPE
ncbi:MAG: molybdopterin oxidoreductase family protein, partial [Gammaproteobacteria bacterium]